MTKREPITSGRNETPKFLLAEPSDLDRQRFVEALDSDSSIGLSLAECEYLSFAVDDPAAYVGSSGAIERSTLFAKPTSEGLLTFARLRVLSNAVTFSLRNDRTQHAYPFQDDAGLTYELPRVVPVEEGCALVHRVDHEDQLIVDYVGAQRLLDAGESRRTYDLAESLVAEGQLEPSRGILQHVEVQGTRVGLAIVSVSGNNRAAARLGAFGLNSEVPFATDKTQLRKQLMQLIAAGAPTRLAVVDVDLIVGVEQPHRLMAAASETNVGEHIRGPLPFTTSAQYWSEGRRTLAHLRHQGIINDQQEAVLLGEQRCPNGHDENEWVENAFGMLIDAFFPSQADNPTHHRAIRVALNEPVPPDEEHTEVRSRIFTALLATIKGTPFNYRVGDGVFRKIDLTRGVSLSGRGIAKLAQMVVDGEATDAERTELFRFYGVFALAAHDLVVADRGSSLVRKSTAKTLRRLQASPERAARLIDAAAAEKPGSLTPASIGEVSQPIASVEWFEEAFPEPAPRARSKSPKQSNEQRWNESVFAFTTAVARAIKANNEIVSAAAQVTATATLLNLSSPLGTNPQEVELIAASCREVIESADAAHKAIETSTGISTAKPRRRKQTRCHKGSKR